MRRSIVVLGALTVAGAAIMQISSNPLATGIVSPESQRVGSGYPTEHLLDLAHETARAFGLDQANTVEYAYLTLGEWKAELGLIIGLEDPNIPVLVVAISGSGEWRGAGGLSSNRTIHGITTALVAETGNRLEVRSGFHPPPYNSGRIYTRIEAWPVSETISPLPYPLMPEQTTEPRSDGPLPLPAIPLTK